MLVNNARELGIRMRDQRLEMGLSQDAFAKRVGVSRSWVVQVERGNAGAEIGLVLKALAALGLDVEVRTAGTPAAPLVDGGESWTPDLAEILDRARRSE
ncbi:MAG TPA: helix-turn-helix domain-containing protein [Longimicrobium sp.]